MIIKAEAFVLYLYFKWKLRKVGYESIRALINQYGREKSNGTRMELDKRADAIIRAVDRTVGLYEEGNPCLHRSLIGAIMLGRRNYAVRIKLGVRFPPFESHAWLEVGHGITVFSYGSENYQAIN